MSVPPLLAGLTLFLAAGAILYGFRPLDSPKQIATDMFHYKKV